MSELAWTYRRTVEALLRAGEGGEAGVGEDDADWACARERATCAALDDLTASHRFGVRQRHRGGRAMTDLSERVEVAPVTVQFEGPRTRCAPLVFNEATLDRGTRKLHATQTEPGVLFGNAFDRLDVEVSDSLEDGLWVHVNRRVGSEWRVPLTDKARPLAKEQVRAALAGRDLIQLWTSIFVASRTERSMGEALEQACSAERVAAWWRGAWKLGRGLCDGTVRVRWHDEARRAKRETVLAPTTWRGADTERLSLAADLVKDRLPMTGLSGGTYPAATPVLVGYVSDGGRLLALGPELR